MLSNLLYFVEGEGQIKSEGDHVSLVVVSQDGSEVHFKIRKNTPLQKLFSSYCQRQGLVNLFFDINFLIEEQVCKNRRLNFCTTDSASEETKIRLR